MPTSARSARERAGEFLRDGGEFHLGPLVTEAAHPRSRELSQVAGSDAAAGLALLFDVDRDVVETYDRWSRSGQPEELRDLALAALDGGGRLFFTGCGATGRLSIQLSSIWRAFWQDRRERGLAGPSPDAWEDRAFSVMAGGDYALIKSVEGFEDFAPFGHKQIADLGVSKGDTVFAITEGGETSFVIGTAWGALEKGAAVVFVYNNPDEVLRTHVTRSREVLDEPRIRKVNLTTGPMAITGSTRMQATSIQLLALLTVLEMTLREMLVRTGTEPAREPSSSVPQAIREGLHALHTEMTSERLRRDLARLVTAEEHVYREGARTAYFADSLAVDVLTDTTERSPTFCTPSFRKWDDREAAESWAFLFTPAPSTEEAWTRLLRREPQTIEWTEEDLRALLDEEAAERQGAVLREIGRAELMRFRIGFDGQADRPARPGDGVTAVVAEPDLPLLEEGAPFARALDRAREAGAETAVIGVGRPAALARLAGTAAARNGDTLVVAIEIPSTPFLLDPLTRVGVKMALNALSTCAMVRLGRVLGNRMIWVVPSNLKLIDRSIRYIQDLAGASYEEACQALFEVIEYVEPRRRAGQAYPAPVGVASMHLRHGLSMEEAETRLSRELGGDAGTTADR
jgi:N-acetylmuramic acid 6-phosphate etherase